MTDILALDFDGVVCNSAAELAHSGWRACQSIWPNDFPKPIGPQQVAAYCQCRPVIKTGFESIPLVRMLVDGVKPEAIVQDFPELLETVMGRYGVNREELIELFGRTRDEWIATDLDGWLAVHEFYPGVIEALNTSPLPQYVITTKQKRFALALIDAAGWELSENRVFGLESGKKGDVLASLGAEFPDTTIHFIEDRLKTLATVAAHGPRQQLRLYYALWGFSTAQEQRVAAETAGICAMQLSDFSLFAANPGRIWGD